MRRKWESVRVLDQKKEETDQKTDQKNVQLQKVSIPFYNIPVQTAVSTSAQLGSVIENRRLSAKDWTQDVRHVEIKLEHDVNYRVRYGYSLHTHTLSHTYTSTFAKNTTGW